MDKNFFSDFESFFGDFDNLFGHSLRPIKVNVKTEHGEDADGKWTKQTYSSPDGSYQMVSMYRTSSKTPKKSNELKNLKKELNQCVESQNFEKAAELRDKIKLIEQNKEKIDSLKSELDKAVAEQNFERAIELRDELKKIES